MSVLTRSSVFVIGGMYKGLTLQAPKKAIRFRSRKNLIMDLLGDYQFMLERKVNLNKANYKTIADILRN